jgi:prepilin-type N-terminal cleavage/methylation domain-containing protein
MFSGTFMKNIFMNNSNHCKGFTILELVMVIVIIAVLLLTVTPKFTDTSTLKTEAAAEQVESFIRYVRSLAISTQVQMSVAFYLDAGDWYFSIKNQKYCIPPGVSLSTSGSITFNSLGEPVPPIGTVSVGSITITVEPITGKVKRF